MKSKLKHHEWSFLASHTGKDFKKHKTNNSQCQQSVRKLALSEPVGGSVGGLQHSEKTQQSEMQFGKTYQSLKVCSLFDPGNLLLETIHGNTYG